MALLHTVNKSPFERDALASCLAHALPGSVVLLIEDGVYAAAAGHALEERIRAALARLELFALGPDLAARGIARERLIEGVGVVDYAGFVELAVRCHAVQAWL